VGVDIDTVPPKFSVLPLFLQMTGGSMAADLTAHADALQSILADRGLLQTSDLEDFRHKVTEEWLPRNGARLCARAWIDPEFKAELLKDGSRQHGLSDARAPP
jgi:hypothetical protein